ncbi:hypothetical protein ACHHYP_20232 [Achlya hypogyna]|uniref:Uncharacterized protein n=1 Tax=Achlya hypogyna TaxID=1202772 RepID=A0A1V9ZNK0_ACHHY|nr:hypothetical protein ACHHYP_20232 [Achlya hypogyna]
MIQLEKASATTSKALNAAATSPHAKATVSAEMIQTEKMQLKAVLWALQVPMQDRLDSDVRVIAHLLRDVLAFLSSQALIYIAAECSLLKLNDSDVLHYQEDAITAESQLYIVVREKVIGV